MEEESELEEDIHVGVDEEDDFDANLEQALDLDGHDA